MIYADTIVQGDTLRYFSSEVPDSELIWHRDPENRLVIATHDTDWQVQLEDELPISLNGAVFIPAGRWHRVIKGKSDLTLKIKKFHA